jgi:hypothetical protein
MKEFKYVLAPLLHTFCPITLFLSVIDRSTNKYSHVFLLSKKLLQLKDHLFMTVDLTIKLLDLYFRNYYLHSVNKVC